MDPPSVKISFLITLHSKDLEVLECIKNYFKVGEITKQSSQAAHRLRISSVKDLAVIIDHFNKYPLITSKWADFELLKQVFYLILKKEHLTIEGFQKIVGIKASMNRGLSYELKVAFPPL